MHYSVNNLFSETKENNWKHIFSIMTTEGTLFGITTYCKSSIKPSGAYLISGGKAY